MVINNLLTKLTGPEIGHRPVYLTDAHILPKHQAGVKIFIHNLRSAKLDVYVRVRYNSNMDTDHNTSKELRHGGEDEALLRIGDVAELTGLTQRTIRYYEEVGLLTPPTRTEGDFRLYSRRDVARLSEIVRLKNLLGFSLGEIRKIVEGEETRTQLRSEYQATEDGSVRLSKLNQALEVAQSQLGLVTGKIAQMQELRAELESRIARYERMKLDLLDLQESEADDVGAVALSGRRP